MSSWLMVSVVGALAQRLVSVVLVPVLYRSERLLCRHGIRKDMGLELGLQLMLPVLNRSDKDVSRNGDYGFGVQK